VQQVINKQLSTTKNQYRL